MLLDEKHEEATGEKELLERLAAGDVKAYERLYNQYYFTIFRTTRKLVDNRAAAEDITTDVFLKLWNRRANFETLAGIRSFLFTVARNACLNYLRDEKRHLNIHQQLSAPSPVQTENDRIRQQITEKVYQHIQEEIGKLSPKMKTILQLHLQGIKNDKIGARLGISEKTVRNLKTEAVKILRVAVLKKDLLLLLFLYKDAIK